MRVINLNSFFNRRILTKFPRKWFSHQMGKLAHIQFPGFINQKIIKKFADYYQVNLKELEKPIKEYKTLGEFFSRRLKKQARPIHSPLIHPCDGELIESGRINNDTLIQAKGVTYKLSQFVPDNPWAENFKKGTFFTYYLAPHNYHRVHCPLDCFPRWSLFIPGDLWPVNRWGLENIENLYAVNERMITGLDSPKGQVILSMVGATNVGCISLSFDTYFKTDSNRKNKKIFFQYTNPALLKAGEEFGVFNLGSTVVMLFDRNWGFSYKEKQKVKMGESFS